MINVVHIKTNYKKKIITKNLISPLLNHVGLIVKLLKKKLKLVSVNSLKHIIMIVLTKLLTKISLNINLQEMHGLLLNINLMKVVVKILLMKITLKVKDMLKNKPNMLNVKLTEMFIV